MSGAKKLIFEQFALVGQALSSGHRLELLDLLVQGERSVDALARASGLTFANASQHLLQLRRAGLVTSRRDGKRVIYALSDPQVWDVVRAVRAVAERNLASVGSLVRQYYTDRDSWNRSAETSCKLGWPPGRCWSSTCGRPWNTPPGICPGQ